MNAWIFQANPKRWDLDRYLADASRGVVAPELMWLVNQHAERICQGDRVYVWRAGKRAGVVAVATVIGDVGDHPEDFPEYAVEVPKFRGTRRRTKIAIKQVLDQPVYRTRLEFEPDLAGLAILRFPQGTNFAVSPAEDRALLALATGQP